MDERVIRFRVGVVVITAAIIAGILIFLFGAWPSFQSNYTIYILFPEAPGVAIQTPVRKSGVPVGRVSNVELLDQGGVVVTLQINENIALWTDEICRINSGSIVTGDAILEFHKASRRPGEQIARRRIKDGDFLPVLGVVNSDPLQVLVNMEDKMSSAFDSIRSAAEEITTIAREASAAFGNSSGRIARIMFKAEKALDQFSSSMKSIEDVVGDPELKAQLKEGLKGLPELVAQAKQTFKKASETMDSFKGVGSRANRNLDHLEKLTKPLGERGGKLVDNLSSSVQNLDELLEQFAKFGRALNNPQGSLGKLMEDPELYKSVMHTMRNMETVTTRLTLIMRDLRYASDKISRDPSSLIRGALRPGPSGIGSKPSDYKNGSSVLPRRRGK